MLSSVESSVLVWRTIVSIGAMFINLIVMVLELHVVNTVISSIVKITAVLFIIVTDVILSKRAGKPVEN